MSSQQSSKLEKELTSKTFNSISNEIILRLSHKVPLSKDSNFIGELIRPFVTDGAINLICSLNPFTNSNKHQITTLKFLSKL